MIAYSTFFLFFLIKWALILPVKHTYGERVVLSIAIRGAVYPGKLNLIQVPRSLYLLVSMSMFKVTRYTECMQYKARIMPSYIERTRIYNKQFHRKQHLMVQVNSFDCCAVVALRLLKNAQESCFLCPKLGTERDTVTYSVSVADEAFH